MHCRPTKTVVLSPLISVPVVSLERGHPSYVNQSLQSERRTDAQHIVRHKRYEHRHCSLEYKIWYERRIKTITGFESFTMDALERVLQNSMQIAILVSQAGI